MFFDERIETASHDEIAAIQLDRLKSTLKRAYENVPLYQEKFDAIGFRPDDLTSLDDLSKLPFTVKSDLRDHYPFGMFAVPKREIVRIHASSGTTGKPTVVGYTKNDLNMWSDVMARLIMATGVTADDTAQISFGYGLFTGALGLHYGLEKVGCSVIPISSGNTERQIMLMRDFESTVLIATPSYALYLAETMEKMGFEPGKDIKLRIGLFGAEASSLEMKAEIERKMGILATENYGLSEIIGPGVSGECYVRDGMHINEDHFLIEIIDPETEEVLPYGERGEVVITALTKEALPIIRYKTRDISRLIPEQCDCGRTSMRMEKVIGRSDDMLIIRGVNVFPSQIETVLFQVKEISPFYEIEVTRQGYMDKLEVKAEIVDAGLLESYAALEALEKRVRHQLYTILGLDVQIRFVQPGTLPRYEGKAKHVKDLRDIF